MKNMKYCKCHTLPPFEMIEAATKEEDITAINNIVSHYSGYIAALSARPMIDSEGVVHMIVDETIKRRLETKLITGILKFKIT